MQSTTLLGAIQLFGDAFVIPRTDLTQVSTRHNNRPSSLVFMSDQGEEDRLRALGYSEDEIKRSRAEPSKEAPEVRVDLVDDVDASTLTAVGFALIALNFFVFANLGDGGIGGIVATIINTVRQ
eukprot:scaffold9308_cov115-Cylindrotheca_fusiformis.AAC.12